MAETTTDGEHYTGEREGKVGTIETLEQARAAHHLASADPERDGTMTGPAHEERYGLDRADHSAQNWRSQGVHPTENRALLPGEPGAENLAGFENTDAPVAEEDTSSRRGANTAESAPRSRA